MRAVFVVGGEASAVVRSRLGVFARSLVRE
jgi:hypothetical protein